MGATAIALPPGAELEAPPAEMQLPPGATLEGAPPAKPGFWERASQGIPKSLHDVAAMSGAPTSWHELADMLQKGQVPFDPASAMVHGYLDTAKKGIQEGAQEAEEAGANVAEGGPIGANIGKALYGGAHAALQLIPGVGPVTETAGQDVQDKNYAGAAGGLTNAIAQVLISHGISDPAIAEHITDTISSTKMTAPVRAAVRGANKVLAKAPATVGAGAGATVGGYFGGHLGAEIGAGAGALAGKEILPAIKIPGEGFGLPNRVQGGPASAPDFQMAAPPAEVLNTPLNAPEAIPPPPTPIEPPEAQPAATQTPEPEDLEGQASPQTENAAAAPAEAEAAHTAVEATPVETPAQTLAKPSASILAQQLNDALGGKPLRKGVSLRNQNLPAPAVAETPLPKGFTPTEDSSLLKGYKYDPPAKEFTAVLKNGQTYKHGEVTPEQVQSFEAADSQGSAWTKHIKQGAGTVLVEKNGAPVIKGKSLLDMAPNDALSQKLANLQDFMGPRKPAAAAVEPAAAAAEVANPDLTTDWSKALADLKAKQPANGPAARIAQGVIKSGAESDVATAPGTGAAGEMEVAKIAKAERIQRAQQIIKDPATSYEEKLVAYKNLQDATVGPPNAAEISARAQARVSQNAAKPRAEVEASTETRKPVQTDAERLAARKNQRKKSGG